MNFKLQFGSNRAWVITGMSQYISQNIHTAYAFFDKLVCFDIIKFEPDPPWLLYWHSGHHMIANETTLTNTGQYITRIYHELIMWPQQYFIVFGIILIKVTMLNISALKHSLLSGESPCGGLVSIKVEYKHCRFVCVWLLNKTEWKLKLLDMGVEVTKFNDNHILRDKNRLLAVIKLYHTMIITFWETKTDN